MTELRKSLPDKSLKKLRSYYTLPDIAPCHQVEMTWSLARYATYSSTTSGVRRAASPWVSSQGQLLNALASQVSRVQSLQISSYICRPAVKSAWAKRDRAMVPKLVQHWDYAAIAWHVMTIVSKSSISRVGIVLSCLQRHITSTRRRLTGSPFHEVIGAPTYRFSDSTLNRQGFMGWGLVGSRFIGSKTEG